MEKKILIIGSSSSIGQHILKNPSFSKHQVRTTSRKETSLNEQEIYIDLNDAESFKNLDNIEVDVAILCAAETSQDTCESERDYSYKINVTNSLELCRRLLSKDTFLIYPSTSLVFGGKVQAPKINDPVNPLGQYAKQKSEMEISLRSINPEKTAVLRFSKIIGSLFPLFEDWVRSLKENKSINPFYDLFFSPISLELACKALSQLAIKETQGIYQLSATRDISYAEAAIYICEDLGLDKSLIKPTSCKNLEKKFDITNFATMDCSSTKSIGIRSPSPFEAIDTYLSFNSFV